jgi:hypothetical protein
MDIVKQLREAHWADARAYAAADEIERLREALKTFANNVKETNVGIDKNWAETVYPLKAENQRLREEIQWAIKDCDAKTNHETIKRELLKALAGEE